MSVCKLPSDDVLDALLAEHGSQRAVAQVLGCSYSAISHRLLRRGVPHGPSFRDWTPEQRGAQSRATWAKLKAEGRAGWTDERRVKYAETWALKHPHTDKSKLTRAALVGPELAELRAVVEALTIRVAELEFRPVVMQRRDPQPGTVQIVEWRPDHRRHADGGKPVREQRREVGLPKRLAAVS